TMRTIAIHGFYDAMEMNRVILERQIGDLVDHRETRVSEQGCTSATIAATMTRADQLSKGYGAVKAADRAPRGSSSAAAPASRSRAGDTGTRFEKYKKNYCNKD